MGLTLPAGRLSMAAAALALVVSTPHSNAATITFDLRAIGGTATIANPKNAIPTALGQTVTLGLYAQIANADGDHSNDGYILANFSIESSEDPVISFRGNLSSVTLNTDVVDPGLSQVGVVQDLDDVTPDSEDDLEVGGTDPSQITGYIIPSNGTSTRFGAGSGAGPTEFLLGTMTWTQNGALGFTGVDVNYFLRVRTDGSISNKQTVKYRTDGVLKSVAGDNSNSPTGEISIGAPVYIGVPEPSALSLLGVGALAALRHRRSI